VACSAVVVAAAGAAAAAVVAGELAPISERRDSRGCGLGTGRRCGPLCDVEGATWVARVRALYSGVTGMRYFENSLDVVAFMTSAQIVVRNWFVVGSWLVRGTRLMPVPLLAPVLM
jgi:hypothetical protein